MIGLRNYFTASPRNEPAIGATADAPTEATAGAAEPVHEPVSDAPVVAEPAVDPAEVPLPQSPKVEAPSTPATPTNNNVRVRRFSFRTFSFTPQQQEHKHEYKQHEHKHEHKHVISAIEEQRKEERAAAALAKRIHKPMSSRSDKRANDSALIVRDLILGPSAPKTASPRLSEAIAKPQMSKVKSQLMAPKSANKIISRLRDLPPSDDLKDTSGAIKSAGPIHAVCLDHTDSEMEELHFSQLKREAESTQMTTSDPPSFSLPSVATSSMDNLTNMFNDLKIVDLILTPDLGLGQPGDGDGLLAGALPTAETVIRGVQQITPQLMALGFATGKAILPDHTGIYPPTDRISVFTYWWGLEVALPTPTLKYLGNVESISTSIVNFLSALALVNNGVKEIVPFVRYIAQFIDFEYSAIQKMDRGQGVVCAATWIMPAAMVPRPWDFAAAPAGSQPPSTGDSAGEPQQPSSPDSAAAVANPAPLPGIISTIPGATFAGPSETVNTAPTTSTSGTLPGSQSTTTAAITA